MQRTALIFATALVAAAALAGMAGGTRVHAQVEKCRGIADSDARLACYNLNSPAALPAAKPAGAKDEKVVTPDDILAAENARLDAKTKNICRGC